MYAVIFKARIAELDEAYNTLAAQLRARAIDQFGCLEFVSLSQGRDELSISYWESEAQIAAWKQDAEHLLAQRLGRERWYESYRVQVTKILRDYEQDANL